MKKILFIHGRSQGGKNQNKLKKEWLFSLKKGYDKNGLIFPTDESFQFAYYGDLLDEFTKKYESKITKSKSVNSLDLDLDYLAFLRETLLEVRNQHGINYEDLLKAGLVEFDQTKAAYNNQLVIATLKFLDINFPALTKFGMETIMRDVYLYLKFADVRNSINRSVLDCIDGDTTLIVSHSLGTAIAYDILKSKVPDPSKYNLVTLGSPLGFSFFKTRMEPIINPLNEKSWYNAYDEKDIISTHSLEPQAFNVKPSVINSGHVKNPSNNHHNITGYLEDKKVASQINEFLIK